MHKIAAELRHRELTQEIYNIFDEVDDYNQNLNSVSYTHMKLQTTSRV